MESEQLYRINDVLTALGSEFGVSLDDDVLDRLTFAIADAIEDKRDEREVD